METAPNPLQQLAAWLAEAMRQPGANHDAMALASSAESRPDVRYVLLKHVSDAGLEFFTHRGSAKGRQLAATPHAAAALYWPGLGRQVRVRGTVSELPRARVEEYFATRSRMSQLGAWASAQSQPLPTREELEQRVSEAAERFTGAAVPTPEHWTGYLLCPLAIEFWSEGEARLHDRILHTRDDATGSWQASRLHP